MDAMQMAEDHNISEQNLPSLTLIGGNDKAIRNETIEEFFEATPNPDKTILTYHEPDHELLQDGEFFNLIMKDVKDWLDIRCAAN
mmetsp:Transcript_29971/g.45832  ORF Transcript_29971/g.45832 Transcript_29971/m.45832 type:complete len:85 (+) Transcript_29971:1223-1477(+)